MGPFSKGLKQTKEPARITLEVFLAPTQTCASNHLSKTSIGCAKEHAPPCGTQHLSCPTHHSLDLAALHLKYPPIHWDGGKL